MSRRGDDLAGSAEAHVDVSSWGTVGGHYSADRRYRWWFRRRWDQGPLSCWIGLNPGTGDTDRRPRPTLRKIVAWSRRYGCGGIVIVNLFAYRTTRPAELIAAAAEGIDIVGPLNDEVIVQASRSAGFTVAAWGGHGRLLGRGAAVTAMLDDPLCLGVTRLGEPPHPLYVPGATELEPYRRP